MSQALQAARALPPSLREAAALGEDAGTLPATLWESGEGQLQHAFRRLQFMAALTGPVLIGACGVWVFLMASAMYGGLNDLCTAILEQM
jgi:type II secretory pathway component PulF